MSREMDEFVDKVRSSADILTVVSSYVSVKKQGRSYFGCCPFHSEKTPSFHVEPEKGLFYCFGCHVGGDVFKFLSLIENITYFEAIKLEAERLNIKLPERKKTAREMEREKVVNELFDANELARKFFHSALVNTSFGKSGMAYLASRGITEKIIESFSLGFAPNAWDKLTTALKKRGVKSEALLKAGLASKSRDGNRIFDRFKNRIMIPIADIRGRTVAFGGRTMGDDNPKYLNTSETPIFKKGEMLFNLDRAHKEIRKLEYSIVVEGYMDAISLVAAGIDNVVASLGTAFTANQAKLLMRYAKKLYFAYDSDEAGQVATVRAMGLAASAGAEVFVIGIPDGKDPDEFVRKHGKDGFLQLIKNAMPLVDFRLQYILKRTNTDTLEGKVRALHDMLPALTGLRDEAKRIYYQKKLASALMLDEGVVRNEMGRMGGFIPVGKSDRKVVHRRENALERAGRILIKEAVEDEAALTYLREVLPVDVIESESQKEIFAELFRDGADINITKLTDDAAAELSRALMEEYEGDAYIDALKLFERQDLNIKYQRKSRELEEAIIRGESGERSLEDLRSIKKALDEL